MAGETFLGQLRDAVLKETRDLPSDECRVRGLWRTELLFQPFPAERLFRYTYLLVQTASEGCCYTDEAVPLDERLLGQDARSAWSGYRSLDIAILDALCGSLPRDPSATFRLAGSSSQKSMARARIVVDEVFHQTRDRNHAPTVLNVGAVGAIIGELQSRGARVFATDLEPSIVGNHINGVQVMDGSENERLTQECDAVVATGMTIFTGGLPRIIEVARRSGTKVVLFAETGANMGPVLCRLGVDSVVGEPFPFYIFSAESLVRIHRAENSG